jgi:SnoaL-like domain
MGAGSQRVQAFLETMQRRDLAAAQVFLAPAFQMTFPGQIRMHKLEELIAWGNTRYQKVGKTYERFDEIEQGDSTIVHCFGTLFGVWLDGRPFEGIRFIDRFEIRDGLFTRQDVWNDLAETVSASRRSILTMPSQ